MQISFGKQRHVARLIREAVDSCPDGICMAALDGRPILANRSINEICARLTGHTIVNALAMWEELRLLAMADASISGETGSDSGEHLLLPTDDGKVWQFQQKPRMLHGTEVLQFEAADITELYQYLKHLEKNNFDVAKLHERQRELLRNIVQNNLSKELLQAKMQIHDDIGRMIIVTRNALADGASGKQTDDIFSGWESVISDLENADVSSDTKASLPEEELVQVAGMIGCQVEFRGKQPSERKALLLLYAAVREALTNAVRHAGANALMVEIQESGDMYHVEITSNGVKAPALPLREGAGLGTLRQRLEGEGAAMTIRTDDGVVMELAIPKE